MREKLEELWEGSQEPFLVDANAEGFDIAEDNIEIVLIGDKGSVVHTKEDLLHDEQDLWYVMVDTGVLGPGLVSAITTFYIPDAICPEGFHKEVVQSELCVIKERQKTQRNGMCNCCIQKSF